MIQAFLLLFMSFNSWASSSPEASMCSGASFEGVERCMKEFNKTINSDFGKSPEPCVALEGSKKKSFPTLTAEFDGPDDSKGKKSCDNFITDKGDESGYGPWGKAVVKYLEDKGDNSIFFSEDLAGMSTGVKACPNWKQMTVDEKKHFWVWTMAAISKVESGCDPQARNGSSTNGVAVGLLQLDERKSQRAWRGDNCKQVSVIDPESNIRCGFDIFGELLKGKDGEYKGNGELWGRKTSSYWQHLRLKNGGGISDLIELNPYCKK